MRFRRRCRIARRCLRCLFFTPRGISRSRSLPLVRRCSHRFLCCSCIPLFRPPLCAPWPVLRRVRLEPDCCLPAFSVKDTTAYRLWLALMAGGISFCAAALFGRVWPETAGAYNGWAAQFYLCAAVGFLLLFAAALMQPEKRRAAVPMALSVLGAAAGFVRLCSFARGGPLPSEGRGGDALEIIAVFGWCIVCGLLLSARLRERTGAAGGKAQDGSGGR